MVTNECIGDGDLEQEVGYVFVKLPALHPDVVIRPQLITPVHVVSLWVRATVVVAVG